jgi:hypothetical protein
MGEVIIRGVVSIYNLKIIDENFKNYITPYERMVNNSMGKQPIELSEVIRRYNAAVDEYMSRNQNKIWGRFGFKKYSVDNF